MGVQSLAKILDRSEDILLAISQVDRSRHSIASNLLSGTKIYRFSLMERSGCNSRATSKVPHQRAAAV